MTPEWITDGSNQFRTSEISHLVGQRILTEQQTKVTKGQRQLANDNNFRSLTKIRLTQTKLAWKLRTVRWNISGDNVVVYRSSGKRGLVGLGSVRGIRPSEIRDNESIMFGQIVIGAPGAGKTTYCDGMSQILSQLGRPVICVNLDPANDYLPYKCDIDIRELVKVEDITSRLNLGPNGALRYCMQTLKKNMEWLRLKLSRMDGYLLFDFPGQLELYNSDDCITSIIHNVGNLSF
ncbi:unnamed protein product [Onchocerca flexuosa]|uniref:GPN-loop GTPase 2 n=1 Tax=Onchocerca flexuosa TaxID=387005 RepID=A0A183HKG5_9BILA|nr:unnamed protein product [Onchocerca flexuosa]